MKGVYSIKKLKAKLVDGEWVAGDVIEELPPVDNRICPYLAQMLAENDYLGREADELLINVSETVFNGALTLEGRSSQHLYTVGTRVVNAAFTASSDPDDAYWTIISNINPPSTTTRNIRTVYLSSNYSGAYDDVYSIVNLTSPCQQETDEILQITYKLILDQTTLQAAGTRGVHANETFFAGLTLSGTPTYGPNGIYVLPYGEERWGEGMKFYNAFRNISVGTNEIYLDALTRRPTNNPAMTPFKQGLINCGITGQYGTNNQSQSSTEWCGWPIKAVGLGNGAGIGSVVSVNKGTDSCVQNTFGKPAGDGITRKPFLDTSNISASAASVEILDRGKWIDNVSDSYTMPYLYRLTVETGGIVGTSTYKLWKRRFCRWIDNNERWYPGGIPLGQMNVRASGSSREHMDKTTVKELRHGQRQWYSNEIQISTADNVFGHPTAGWTGYFTNRYVFPEFITFDYTGITINDINHRHVSVDADTTPALNVTGVLQIETDGSDIYVACENTGLFLVQRDIGDFDASNFTITQLSPPGISDATSCRGVVAKGGGRHGHPGKILAVRVLDGGSNYAVDDTVTFAGAFGTSATAQVASVDANGAITSVSVTNRGSGYIEDNIQAYVSTGNGVGASLEPIIGSGGDIWALFDDATDASLYLAHLTHIGSNNYTSGLTFATAGDTITRTDGTDFLADGFRPGQTLIVRTPENAGNEGRFTITNVTATVITVSENLTDSTGADSQAQIFAEKWEIMRESITTTESLTFADANPDTIVGTGGTTLEAQGFREGMEIVVSGTTSNDGTYTIAGVTGNTITLDSQDALTAEGPVSCTLATLTDFTLNNYTSGSPGRSGIIGMSMDPDHPDDRFAMITPTNKNVNDGSEPDYNDGDGGVTWWDFANSTGTTAAGTSTPNVRVGGGVNNKCSSIEQYGPMTVGPFGTNNEWTCSGESDVEGGYMTWNSTSLTDRPYPIPGRYIPMRNSSGNIAVLSNGAANSQQLRTCVTTAQMGSSTSSDSVLLYDYGGSDTSDFTPATCFNKGFVFGYLGKGIMWSLMLDFNEANGFHIWTCYGNGTKTTTEALPYGFWDEYGWDGTRWVLGHASAKTTHAQSTFSGTSLNINATTGAIVGSGGSFTDWATDGFVKGDTITIATATDSANDGLYRIESLSGTTLTVTPDKLPAVTNAADGTATIVGSRELVDSLAVSFDDNVGNDALIVDEYYDTHLFDGILKDNATNFNFDTYHAWMADATGTTFSNAGTTTTTIPSSNKGPVTNIPLAALYWEEFGSRGHGGMADSGSCWWVVNNSDEGTAFSHKIPQSTDFVLRYKVAGVFGGAADLHVGLVPWTTITDGTYSIVISELDENMQVYYDGINYPELNQYTIIVRSTGNGTILHTENTDRVQVVADQTHANYDNGAGNGVFVDGTGYSNGDVITLDDGSTVTVDAQIGGQITQFTVSSKSLRSSGRTQRNVGSVNYTSLTFANTGSTITRSGGTAFDTDGFLVGMRLIVDGSTSNDGVYEITAVTDTVITVAETLTDETWNSPTQGTDVFNTGLYQTSVTPSGGSGFAITLGTNNETAVDALQGGLDEFSFHRIGTGAGNLTCRLNGVVFYTFAGALHTTTDMGVVAHADTSKNTTLFDASIDYEIDRRYLTIGNGTTTGADDPNFRCMTAAAAGTDMLRLYYDSGSGPVEFVYNKDGYTPPAAGEVTLIPFQGGLWFNSAQDGDTITGNWTITKGYNLQ